MAPLPTNNSTHAHWDNNSADQKLLSEDGLAPLPPTPSTAEKSSSKRKSRSRKDSKSPRHVSPPTSMDICDEDDRRQKDSRQSPNADKSTPSIRKKSTPPPPPLSSSQTTPATPIQQPNRIVNRSKGTPKSSNKKAANGPSPKTDLRHREAANQAADAGSCRKLRRSRKKLHWNNSVRVKVIHNLGNYTPQEKRDAWYCPDEYSMMEDECELTSIHMDEIDFEEENALPEENSTPCKRTLPAGFCERGLESWTMHGEELKEHQVSLVIDTVWQAQIDAWEFLGVGPSKSNDENSNHTSNSARMGAIYSDCWDFIREKCTAVSMPSMVWAQERAIQDEQDIDAYLNPVRSLENSRRRITKMFGGKNSSSRSITRSSRSLSTAKSQRTLTTVSSSDSTSFCGPDNIKSILKTPKSRRSYNETRPIKRSPSQSPIPLNDINSEERDSFRMHLPKIGNDNNSMRSKSLRSQSMRSNSLRSNRSSSMRSNVSRSNRSSSLRSCLSRTNSLRSNSVRSSSLRSSLSRSNSMRSTSVRSSLSRSSRSNGLSSHSDHSNMSSYSHMSSGSKKIRYRPKSKTKIPTSPVASVCSRLSQNFSTSNHGFSDEEDISNRMMRSHMSVSQHSEGSSRRRMLRAPPL